MQHLRKDKGSHALKEPSGKFSDILGHLEIPAATNIRATPKVVETFHGSTREDMVNYVSDRFYPQVMNMCLRYF
jgi:hypothetical protein